MHLSRLMEVFWSKQSQQRRSRSKQFFRLHDNKEDDSPRAGAELACYENYTKFAAVVKYTAGILGIVMYQEEQAPEDRIKALEKEKNEIQEKINQLEGCILEMSEQVYQ